MNVTAGSVNAIEITTAPAPQWTVIWLHGLGADGNDFAPLVPMLAPPTPTRFIFPHAPIRPITVNGGMRMRGWYDLASAAVTRDEDAAGLDDAAKIVHTFIAREQDRGISAAHIFIGGFSQGGAVALHAGLRFGARLAGLLALSAYLPLAEFWLQSRAAENAHTPVMMAHGAADAMLPIQLARDGFTRLTAGGQPAQWFDYPIAHSVCPEEIVDAQAFLRTQMESV